MKLRILAITIFAVAAVVGCTKDEGVVNDNFALSFSGADMSDDKLMLDFKEQTIVVNVTTEDTNGKWDVYSPAEYSWCSFDRRDRQLIITVDSNEQSNDVRATWLEFSVGKNTRKIEMEQECLRSIAFAYKDMTIGASTDNFALPYVSNIAIEELTVTADPDVSWISNLRVEEGAVTGTVQGNPSATDTRSIDIILSGRDKQATLTLTQNELSGYLYAIDLSGATFEDALIYEIWDEEHNIKIGELCKEYLYKYDAQNSRDIVKMRAVVAYPMLKSGGADLMNGIVVDNGGSIAWNMAVNSSTPASDYITSYAAGTSTEPLKTIYRRKGDFKLTTTPVGGAGVSAAEIVNAVLRPYIVTDTRTGAADNAGETTETFTYKVVKVATQYWMAENLKTTRLRDGSPIPTNIATANWAIANVGQAGSLAYSPGCLLTGLYSSSGGYASNLDANSNDPAAVEAREKYGVQYSFHAVIGQTGTQTAPLMQPLTDVLSPQGWSVPTYEEFKSMLYYVSQVTPWGDITANNSSSSGIYLPQLSGELGTNETGLSMDGARYWRGSSGLWNTNLINYYTMSGYQFSAQPVGTSPHSITVFRIYADSSSTSYLKSYFYLGLTHYGINVRCIRK